MKLAALLISTFICGFVVYLAELPAQKVYDCRYVTYPIAVDVPQQVIHECHKRNLT
jgi:hypothetical protein